MKNLTRFEEKYEAYLAERKASFRAHLRVFLIWSLILIAVVALFVLRQADIEPVCTVMDWVAGFFYALSDGPLGFVFQIVFAAVIGAFVFFPVFVWKGYHSVIARKNQNMSLLLMDELLTQTFGQYTQETVTYPILQSRCTAASKAEKNIRLDWTRSDSPFLIHRAKITNGEDGEDYVLYFDGTAISVPLPFHSVLDDPKRRTKTEQNLTEKWKKLLRERVDAQFLMSLDEIDGRPWLTVGFRSIKLGETDVQWQDLQVWYSQCRDEVALLERAVNLVRSISEDIQYH